MLLFASEKRGNLFFSSFGGGGGGGEVNRMRAPVAEDLTLNIERLEDNLFTE